MRELRVFELDEPEQPVSLRAGYGQNVKVTEGRVWITMEGCAADFWLQPGEVLALAEGERYWLSGEGGPARFALAAVSAPLSWRLAAGLRVLAHRWGEWKTDAFGECPRLGVR
ncbi:DUF2917 domain-containing protein [Cupriavidus sp. WKF15]|uniref:DUF2917 domain-containing protein n=1 Tax=Cupriavidus sp. WKF15 TaxID=3032282 RepID=UPI0023E0BBE2|nr:DUF2917 domain-containing protein [Cupriavidus sp. WKF15]WER46264.1 DUF2917 domain-containing protein [Cupriavidus sp. WKF15]